jgi:hypothetical protein
MHEINFASSTNQQQGLRLKRMSTKHSHEKGIYICQSFEVIAASGKQWIGHGNM